MIPNDAFKRMLPFIGVTVLDLSANANDPGKRQLLQSDIDFGAGCQTGALEEIYAGGPAAISERRLAFVLNKPTTISVTTVSLSTAITVSGWQDWMIGCTVRIPEDSQDNEFVSATELLKPWMGETSGVQPSTVYGDAVKLPEGTDCVLEPVEIPLWKPLVPATSREQFITWNLPTGYRNEVQPGVSYYVTINKAVGWPVVWFAEAAFDPSEDFLPIFLRVNPMPSQAFSITMRARLQPPVITAADIYDGTPSDPGPDFNIPLSWHESVFLPFAMQRWTAHPSFTNEGSKKEIARQYQVAKNKLDSYAASGAASLGEYYGAS